MSGFVIDESPVPASLDAEDAADFIAAVIAANDVEAYEYGTDDLRLDPIEVLPYWQDPGSPRRLFVGRVDGRVVARAAYMWQVDEPGHSWLLLEVLPEFRRRGIGTALLETVQAVARGEGRTKLITYAPIKDGPGERVHSPTGFGSVPRENSGVQFLLGHGFTLEQLERGSRLQLPVTIDLRDALQHAGADYRLHTWEGPTPERWLADMALLFTRMSTDAPSAGLEEPEDTYTVERILAIEKAEATSPRVSLVAVAEHVPTGRLAGFTKLTVPAETHRAVMQDDTLVLKEHRGHGLGMLLKSANLEFLQRARPGHPSVVTYNAEENRYMLDVNEALGYVPMGYEGAWRKNL